MKPRSLCLFAIVGLLTAGPAFALTLDAARSSGAVGEGQDGYVGVIKVSPEVQALAADVNVKRQQEYQRISKANGQPVDVVAKLAAQQIVGKLAPGAMYQAADGSWKAK